jgi:NAD(P)-dependent dehydrogenase (short-subunit alcohol dehydrogenase family)
VPLHALVFDAGASFGSGGEAGLRAALELAWLSARAVATGALIEADGPGKLVFVAPRPDAGPHAQAARAALENLARTLSVEWARFTVTAVTIAPGPATTEHELAQLVGFLVSDAGAYLSGCRFDLGTLPVAGQPPLI